MVTISVEENLQNIIFGIMLRGIGDLHPLAENLDRGFIFSLANKNDKFEVMAAIESSDQERLVEALLDWFAEEGMNASLNEYVKAIMWFPSEANESIARKAHLLRDIKMGDEAQVKLKVARKLAARWGLRVKMDENGKLALDYKFKMGGKGK